MFGIGTQELLIILLILLLLFGGKRLPELSRSIGEAVREMKKAISGDENASTNTNQKARRKK